MDREDASTGRAATPTPRKQTGKYQRTHDFICQTPCSCWLPTLLVDPKDDQRFQTACALALSCLGEEDPNDFSGRWDMTTEEKMKLLEDIERSIHEASTSRAMTPQGTYNNMLELREIDKFQKDHPERILRLPNSVHGIGNHRLMVEAFDKYDLDSNGSLDDSEWSSFLDTLAIENLKSLLRQAHVRFRAFFARGQPWNEDTKTYDVEELRLSMIELAKAGQPPSVVREGGGDYAPLSAQSVSPPQWQCGWDGPSFRLPIGWWPDLVYYSANNHPLHGIFACDSWHPLSWVERLAMEVASIGFSAATLALHDKWVIQHFGLDESSSHWLEEISFSLLVVTLPGFIMWHTLFCLFTCGRCHPNEAKVPEQEVTKAWRWRTASATFGYVLIIVGIAGWFSVHYLDFFGRELHRRRLLLGRLKAYIIVTFIHVFITFNPFVAWGQPIPGEPLTFGDYIGLGKWRIEKQRFQAMCGTGAQKI